ncbi:MAG: uL15 family ribosomal protein [Patescibacteria group bacterium]
MQLHELKRTTKNRSKKRVGRGGKRGKTSGRGHKGQKARSGHRIRPEIRDMIKKIPKQRGYGKHRATSVRGDRIPQVVINIGTIDKYFADGAVISPATLHEKGLIKMRTGKLPSVKILGKGKLTKKVTYEGVKLSGKVSGATK